MKWQQNLYQQLCKIIIIHSTLCLDAIPDPRAYIWTAGQDLLEYLGQHIDNMLPSGVSPRTVNGLSMASLGKLAITIKQCIQR